MTPTPTTRRVKLKRVSSLQAGDSVIPGLGLFTRDGQRIESGLSPLGREARVVLAVELDSSGLLAVDLELPGVPVMFTPADAYVVLA